MKYAAKIDLGSLYISRGDPDSCMPPALINTILSETDIASSWSWVTCNTVMPNFLTNLRISYLSSTRTRASNADRGSSSISIFDPEARALAMATFCCSPPESSPGNIPARSSILTNSRYSVETDSVTSLGMSLTRGLYPTFSIRSMLGNRAMFWNTYPVSLSSIGTSVTS